MQVQLQPWVFTWAVPFYAHPYIFRRKNPTLSIGLRLASAVLRQNICCEFNFLHTFRETLCPSG